MRSLSYLDKHSGGITVLATIITAVATVILAVITGVYAWSTHNITQATQEQSKAIQENTEQTKKTVERMEDNLIPVISVDIKMISAGSASFIGENKEIEINMTNYGNGPALLR